MRIVQRQEVTPEILDVLSRASHNVYRKNAVTDVARLPWEKLPEELKESNRAHIRFLEKRLRTAGYVAVPMRGAPEPLDLAADLLEILAEQEHDRFNKERLKDDWVAGYPKEIPPKGKVNQSLVPWDELPEGIKHWDRVFIINLPVTLASSGYTIKPLVDAPGTEKLAGPRVFRIGTTGHRDLNIDDTLESAVVAALEKIREAACAERGEVDFEVVSPLAEGADRLIVRLAMEHLDAKLKVPLPLKKGDYRKDFKVRGSKKEFDDLLRRADKAFVLPQVIPEDRKDARALAYEQAGRFVVDDADVLIAIWDGKEARGVGGTAKVVAFAKERNGETWKERIVHINPMELR